MTKRYYVVREDILPEAIMKTIQVKEMLSRGEAATVHEAVERAGLSRSAFYKYKDGVYALNELERERIATISMDLEHRSGVLSNVLSMVAGLEGNVLTMNQTIPLQGFANVVISVDISQLSGELSSLVEMLRSQPGVRKASVIGQG
ncbi:ACT domain-containing protein [Paenibacillus sp. LHD-38]|uniref:ACT domain-containing protein n=1 Tax=Paenibacillus sp. LHD-38 TaxID=3072143 RepID=UPI00280D7A3B|nr:ACT domain-containing protein [Paenibacillus sp. LHD-38]MDQ8737388.1 ACT domain-containing protein [Paenibacillus sp. LHD-38]